jgi:hypothetical protein
MKRIAFYFILLSTFNFQLSTLSAQTYVWKAGKPLVVNPDSITFVEPDMGLQVVDTAQTKDGYNVKFLYLTQDHMGRPQWHSALLQLSTNNIASKHIGVMALYNHYTIMSAEECPTAGNTDMQSAALAKNYAVVSTDYEGFGETADKIQAYCFGEVNARASIDALLAAREWLAGQGYTMSDSIINYGYSQGGQTTVAALRLSQTEYKGKVHFLKSIAGAGPYNLTLTYKTYVEWERIAKPAALPLNVITLNELYGIGLAYDQVFKSPLSSNWKTWFVSKRFTMDEADELLGSDSLYMFIQPQYLDTTSAETKQMMSYTDRLNVMDGWTPDADTDLKIYHSQKDDVVPFGNSRELYRFFESQGCNHVAIDSVSLNMDHEGSGMMFIIALMTEFSKL